MTHFHFRHHSVRLPLCCDLSHSNNTKWGTGGKVQPLLPYQQPPPMSWADTIKQEAYFFHSQDVLKGTPLFDTMCSPLCEPSLCPALSPDSAHHTPMFGHCRVMVCAWGFSLVTAAGNLSQEGVCCPLGPGDSPCHPPAGPPAGIPVCQL